MPCSFPRTSRSIERELSEKTPLYLGTSLFLMIGWLSWMLFAQVPVYTQSSKGRLEVATTTHRAAAPAPGRVAAFAARLGDRVTANQVLLRLDDGVERRRLDEARAQVSALELRAQAVEAELQAEEEVRAWQARSFDAAVAQSRASLAEAQGDLVFKRKQAEMAVRLQQEALISGGDALVHAQGLAKIQSQIASAEASVERQRVSGLHADQVQAAKVAEVKRQRADLAAQRLAALAAVETALAQLDRKVVRAPIAGRVGSIASLQTGDVLNEGTLVATVVPEEPLRIVAEFEPTRALGRIRPQQRARVRLSGFTLAEVRRFEATVREVASEPQSGSIRVELQLPASIRDGRLKHGLPVQVEVHVDSATPWQLVMRTVGELVAPPPAESLPTSREGEPVSRRSPVSGIELGREL